MSSVPDTHWSQAQCYQDHIYEARSETCSKERQERRGGERDIKVELERESERETQGEKQRERGKENQQGKNKWSSKNV